MRMNTIFTSLLFVVLMTSFGMSQTVLVESFNYAAGASIDADLGTAGDGWAGPWALLDGTDSLAAVADAGLIYEDLVDPVSHAGNFLKVSNPGGWVAARYNRPVSEMWPDEAGTEYWISVLFQTGAEPTGNTYYLLKLFSYATDSSEILAIGKSGGGVNYSCGSGWAGGAGDDYSDVTCISDPVWLVTKIVCSGDTSADRTYMWINPSPSGGEPDTMDADVARNTTMYGGFNSVAIECGGEDVMDTYWDEIRIGKSWADVSAEVSSVPQNNDAAPVDFTLSQNYPNPFNPTTNISFTLANSSNVRLVVTDINGREVGVVVDGHKNAGTHHVSFSGADLASGVYFYKLSAANQILTRKMMLLK